MHSVIVKSDVGRRQTRTKAMVVLGILLVVTGCCDEARNAIDALYRQMHSAIAKSNLAFSSKEQELLRKREEEMTKNQDDLTAYVQQVSEQVCSGSISYSEGWRRIRKATGGILKKENNLVRQTHKEIAALIKNNDEDIKALIKEAETKAKGILENAVQPECANPAKSNIENEVKRVIRDELRDISEATANRTALNNSDLQDFLKNRRKDLERIARSGQCNGEPLYAPPAPKESGQSATPPKSTNFITAGPEDNEVGVVDEDGTAIVR